MFKNYLAYIITVFQNWNLTRAKYYIFYPNNIIVLHRKKESFINCVPFITINFTFSHKFA